MIRLASFLIFLVCVQAAAWAGGVSPLKPYAEVEARWREHMDRVAASADFAAYQVVKWQGGMQGESTAFEVRDNADIRALCAMVAVEPRSVGVRDGFFILSSHVTLSQNGQPVMKIYVDTSNPSSKGGTVSLKVKDAPAQWVSGRLTGRALTDLQAWVRAHPQTGGSGTTIDWKGSLQQAAATADGISIVRGDGSRSEVRVQGAAAVREFVALIQVSPDSVRLDRPSAEKMDSAFKLYSGQRLLLTVTLFSGGNVQWQYQPADGERMLYAHLASPSFMALALWMGKHGALKR
jgi:hypothetical protein